MEKFIYAVTTLFLCVLLNSPFVSILVVMINAIVLINKAGIKPEVFIKLMLIPLYFLFIGTLTVAFNLVNPESNSLIISFSIFDYNLGITQSSLYQAFNLFLKALGSVSCLYFLTLTTPLLDIISVMRKLKVPELFLEIMGLVYRFIFILLSTAETIYNSQSSRLGYNSLKTGFKSMGYLVSNLFVLSFNRANQMFTALESRGYTGSIRVLENNYKFSIKNVLAILFAQILILSVFSISKLCF